jgi:uncharacterized lipoprotein YmbA
MMDRFSSRLTGFVVGVLVLVLSGCASTPPTRFFVLSPVSGVEKMGNREGERCFAIAIGPVKIPEYLNQPEIVTSITQNELRLDEFAKWAEPLENNISRALAENLSSLLCTQSIAIFPWKGGTPIDYRIDVHVIQMYGMLGEDAFLDVSWSIADGADRKKPALVTKRSRYKEPTGGGDYGAFVSAQGRNLASLSRDIAEAILILSK